MSSLSVSNDRRASSACCMLHITQTILPVSMCLCVRECECVCLDTCGGRNGPEAGVGDLVGFGCPGVGRLGDSSVMVSQGSQEDRVDEEARKRVAR